VDGPTIIITEEVTITIQITIMVIMAMAIHIILLILIIPTTTIHQPDIPLQVRHLGGHLMMLPDTQVVIIPDVNQLLQDLVMKLAAIIPEGIAVLPITAEMDLIIGTMVPLEPAAQMALLAITAIAVITAITLITAIAVITVITAIMVITVLIIVIAEIIMGMTVTMVMAATIAITAIQITVIEAKAIEEQVLLKKTIQVMDQIAEVLTAPVIKTKTLITGPIIQDLIPERR
jgi:hypothetical protein